MALVTSLWGPIAPTADAQGNTGAEVPGLRDPPWRAWHTETVRDKPGLPGEGGFENEGHASGEIRVETASDGSLRLLFAWLPPGEVANIVYAWPEGGEWRFDRVEHKALPGDLALDGEGNPWIAWLKDGETYVATRNATDEAWWRMKIADSGNDPRIAVAPNGTVHVAFGKIVDGVDPVRHGRFDPDQPDQGWTFTTADHGIHRDLDLALDGDGRPHIVWTPGLGPSRYAVKTAEGWSAMDISDCKDENAIAIGPTGTPHVACYAEGGPWGVVHAVRQADGSWRSEVASDGSQLVPPRGTLALGNAMDIAVDEDDRAHISFATSWNPFWRDDPTRPARPVYAVNANGPCPSPVNGSGLGSVQRAQNPCTDWHVQAVDHDGTNAALSTDIALDGDGVPSLAYTYRFRMDARGCHEVTNPCRDLRLATPLSAELGLTS